MTAVLPQRPEHQQHRLRRAAEKQAALWFAGALSTILAVVARSILPAKYFGDSAVIQSIANGTDPVEPDPSYRAVGAFYRLLDLQNRPGLTAILTMAVFTVIMLAIAGRGRLRHARASTMFIVYASFLLNAIYVAPLSKEFVVLIAVGVIAQLAKLRFGLLAIALFMLLYSIEFRSYWIVVAAMTVFISVTVRRRSGPRALAVIALVGLGIVAIAIWVEYHESLTVFRYALNVGRVGSADATTLIPQYVGGSSPVIGWVNAAVTLALLLIPLPLLARLSPQYVISVVFLITCTWRGVQALQHCARAPVSLSTTRAARCLSAYFGMVLVQSVYVPDYGSALKHLAPLLPLLALGLLEADMLGNSGSPNVDVGPKDIPTSRHRSSSVRTVAAPPRRLAQSASLPPFTKTGDEITSDALIDVRLGAVLLAPKSSRAKDGSDTNRRSLAVFGSVGRGLIGQGLSFLGMLLPLAFSPKSAVVAVVVASAIANASLYFSTVALPMLYPSTRDSHTANVALRAAVTALVGTVSVVCLAGAGILVSGGRIGAFLLAGAVLLLFVGFDSIVITWLVRASDHAGIMENRLKYGVCSVVISTVVALTWHWRWSLVVSSCAVYFATAIWVAASRWPSFRSALADTRNASNSEIIKYLRANMLHAASYLVNGVATQAANLSLVGLGSLAAPWAAAGGVTGGFATTQLQLVTPGVDASVGKRVREENWFGARRELAVALTKGIAIAALALPSSAALAWFLGYFDELTGSQMIVFAVALALYAGTNLAVISVSRVMSLLGLYRIRIRWDLARFVLMFACLLLAKHQTMLLSISVAAAVMNLIYVAIIWRAVGRRAYEAATYRRFGN